MACYPKWLNSHLYLKFCGYIRDVYIHFFTYIYVPLFYTLQVEKHKILQVGNDKAGAFTNMEGMKLLRLELTTSH